MIRVWTIHSYSIITLKNLYLKFSSNPTSNGQNQSSPLGKNVFMMKITPCLLLHRDVLLFVW